MCARLALAAAGALLLALLVTHAAARYDRRADMSPMPFVMGTRYGRSPEQQPVAQRSDRFFMGSRYGKRSEVAYPSPVRRAGAPPAGTDEGPGPLVCQYTGLRGLYRCEETQHQRISDESEADEQV